LIALYPPIKIKSSSPTFLPSFDIDNAYAYKGKGFFRNTGGFLRDILKGKFSLVSKRIKVAFGKLPDPYDSYAYIFDQLNRNNLTAYWFIPVGKRAAFDKNLPAHVPIYKSLIAQLKEYGEIGLHPSYESNSKNHLITEERKTLENISGQSIVSARQHYLKLKIPATYNRLIESGIKADYTMGFASHYGFRAGTSLPFSFYDLKKEQKTDLWIHPFAYMDGTLNEYMKMNTIEAKSIISKLAEQIKQTDGNFICIWHNDSLRDDDNWKGWREVFEHTIQVTSGL